MYATLGAARLAKRQWYAAGGFANPRCFRQYRRGWRYYMRIGS